MSASMKNIGQGSRRIFQRSQLLFRSTRSTSDSNNCYKRHSFCRFFSVTGHKRNEGLVLGLYEPAQKDGAFILTPASQYFNQRTEGRLEKLLNIAGHKLKCGEARLFYGLDDSYQKVAVANLGKQDAGYDPNEQVEMARENVRGAVAAAVRVLRDVGETKVLVDPCGDAEAAAEGCSLSLFAYDELKSEDNKTTKLDLNTFVEGKDQQPNIPDLWSRGLILGEGQNFARFLKEKPANRLTPTRFCEEVQAKMAGLENVQVTVRDQQWAESMKMGSFISVAKGSDEPLKFLEVDYQGGKPGDPPVVFVGKGITFDSGGISIKPSKDMDKMRADMGGAAAVVGSIWAAASLKLPINVKGLTPLCENLPSGQANKPGDVVTAMNGKTIQVDNTDAEGRLILADALCYAETFQPRLILDIATLTGAIIVALGPVVSGVFTNSDTIWHHLLESGKVTGDRMWRMPLFKYYTKCMKKSDLADLNNIGGAGQGGASTAAAFLKEFVTTDQWVHLDIAGTMINSDTVPYLGKGMTGRPTRTLVQFLERLSKETA